jgi:type II secretory pathway pseudopilin PulG
VRARLKSGAGFGLVELLIAMSVMTIAITAVVAGFSSGMVALANASRTGTAGALADKQMEAYRALEFTSIPTSLDASQSVTGPDGRAYAVATTIVPDCPVGGTPPACVGARPVKKVTVTVADAVTHRTYISETSTFDEAA